MDKQLQQLPLDVQKYIFSKIYYPQPEELLKDIRNFTITRRKIIKRYSKLETNKKNKYFWLANDISLYFNNNICYGVNSDSFQFSKGNIEKINRLFISKLNKKNLYISFHDLCCVQTKMNKLRTIINRCLGCLTPKERLDFLGVKTTL